MERKDLPQTPLTSEALKRGGWRGEDEKEAGSPDEADGARGPSPIAGTMLPPD